MSRSVRLKIEENKEFFEKQGPQEIIDLLVTMEAALKVVNGHDCRITRIKSPVAYYKTHVRFIEKRLKDMGIIVEVIEDRPIE